MRQITEQDRVRKVAAPCQWCGQEFFQGRRAGRHRQFCSNACRQAAFRNADFEGGNYPTGRYEIAPKTSTKSVAFKADFVDGPFPKIDPKTRARIFEMELAPMWSGGREVVSPDGVICFVMREGR